MDTTAPAATLTDAQIAQGAQARLLRAQVSAWLPMLRKRLKDVDPQAPTVPRYVIAAVTGLIDACDRWEQDEHGSPKSTT